ncbi:Tat (twin-arginine translocation) pathway signal sequence [Pedobacter nyackensis]|uniref:Tat (Twin-arginine translocation) pathway signal sequence n=2 Tax=Pedobacter nyackensis TaxID=475255 RepID=A0A1W2F7B5_9SPHI|nr:Tat (twin-arginine translocation) pathway signal sequence [Pedobacter nyackensis]
MTKDRRSFIKDLGLLSGAVGLGSLLPLDAFGAGKKEFFSISLAEWSLHNTLFAKKLDNLDFPLKAKKDFGIDIVEYVSVFFDKKEKDPAYLKELKSRTDGEGIQNHLIMVDNEGNLGDADPAARLKAVENHYKWVDAAKYLGCKTIRVNAAGKGTAEQVKDAAVDGLGKLTEYGKKHRINVIVENHGGYSSNGAWLADVIKQVNSPFCGTLPDFGNFALGGGKEYDKYLGVEEMMPYAKGVSAKSMKFNENGEESDIDYERMFKIINAAKWRGIVGIEFSGPGSEDEGIRKTKQLLEKIRKNYK